MMTLWQVKHATKGSLYISADRWFDVRAVALREFICEPCELEFRPLPTPELEETLTYLASLGRRVFRAEWKKHPVWRSMQLEVQKLEPPRNKKNGKKKPSRKRS